MNTAIAEASPPTALLVEQKNLMWQFRGTTYEEHLACWEEIASEIERDSWMLGAIAASLVSKYKEKTIDSFAHAVRLSARRIREIASTYRAFQNGERSPILSFHHHTVAARGVEYGVDPVEAIHKAEDKEWSTRELETFVKTGVEPDDKARKVPVSLKSVQRLGLIRHIEFEAMPTVLELKAKCPNPQFASKFYGQWYDDLKEAKEEIEREDFSESLASAWRKGNHTTADLARATNQSLPYVYSVLHDLEEADPPIFERVERGGETEEARGKNEMVWHLVGEPVGSNYSAPRPRSVYSARE